VFHNSIWVDLELCLGAKTPKAPPWRRDCCNPSVY